MVSLVHIIHCVLICYCFALLGRCVTCVMYPSGESEMSLFVTPDLRRSPETRVTVISCFSRSSVVVPAAAPLSAPPGTGNESPSSMSGQPPWLHWSDFRNSETPNNVPLPGSSWKLSSFIASHRKLFVRVFFVMFKNRYFTFFKD